MSEIPRRDLKVLVERAPGLATLPDRLRAVLCEILTGREACTARKILDRVGGRGTVDALVRLDLVEVWPLKVPGPTVTLTGLAAELLGVELIEHDITGDGLAAEPYWVVRGKTPPDLRMHRQRGSSREPYRDMVADRGPGPVELAAMAEAAAQDLAEDFVAPTLWGMRLTPHRRTKPRAEAPKAATVKPAARARPSKAAKAKGRKSSKPTVLKGGLDVRAVA